MTNFTDEQLREALTAASRAMGGIRIETPSRQRILHGSWTDVELMYLRSILDKLPKQPEDGGPPNPIDHPLILVYATTDRVLAESQAMVGTGTHYENGDYAFRCREITSWVKAVAIPEY